jgi:hypothetical protein
VAIAAGFAANVLPLLKLRVPLGQLRDEAFLPLGLRANFQQALAHGHIDRQFGRHVVRQRNAAFGLKARRILTIQDLMTLIAELLEAG